MARNTFLCTKFGKEFLYNLKCESFIHSLWTRLWTCTRSCKFDKNKLIKLSSFQHSNLPTNHPHFEHYRKFINNVRMTIWGRERQRPWTWFITMRHSSSRVIHHGCSALSFQRDNGQEKKLLRRERRRTRQLGRDHLKFNYFLTFHHITNLTLWRGWLYCRWTKYWMSGRNTFYAE